MPRCGESLGGPKNCLPMVWLGSGAERRSKAKRRRPMRKRVHDGIPVGILADARGEAVGWCSVAPRPTLRFLDGPADEEAGEPIAP